MSAPGHWDVWASDPLIVPLALAVPVVLYGIGWWPRRREAGALRPLAFLLGIEVLVVALISPLHHVGSHYLLSIHMVQHVLIGDVAPLLLVLGVTGALTAMLPRWALRLAGPPWLAFLVWGAVTGGWYVPALYERALATPALHALMLASIVVGGLMAWAHIVGVVERPISHARRAAFAIGLMGVGFVVSEVLFLSGPLYPVYADQPDRLFGLSPVADQTKAALIMGAEGMITMVTAAALLMWGHVNRLAAERDVASSARCAPPESSH